MKNILKILLLLFVVGAFFNACQKDVAEIQDSISAKDETVTGLFEKVQIPDGPGGNATCDDLDVEFEFTTERFTDGDQWNSGDEFIQGIKWYTSEDGRELYFMLQTSMKVAVIVKGGPGNFAYISYDCLDPNVWYGPFTAPNVGRNVPQVSNVTFCYTPCEDCEWRGETAWAANGDVPGEIRYVQPGNWATYVEYSGESKTVSLFAGRTLLAGFVEFTPIEDDKVEIKITLLDENWRLDPETDEKVKIQGYDEAPTGNPQVGLFNTYKGNDLTIVVDKFNFYGVHLDVEWQYCPPPVE